MIDDKERPAIVVVSSVLEWLILHEHISVCIMNVCYLGLEPLHETVGTTTLPTVIENHFLVQLDNYSYPPAFLWQMFCWQQKYY